MSLTKLTKRLLSLFTAKGDILTFSGSGNPAILPVGTDTWVLTADSTATNGIKWAVGGGGGSSTIDKIVQVYGPGVPLIVQTGAAFLHIPANINGKSLTTVHALVPVAGVTGLTTIMVTRLRSGTTVNMLSTALTIDSTETGSDTAATAAVIDATNKGVSTNDVISIDVTGVSTTAPMGLVVTLEFA